MPSTTASTENWGRQGEISAVVTICAQQKRVKVGSEATPAVLEAQQQPALELAWQRAIAALPAEVPVSDLYAGRAFGLAKTAASRSSSPLFVISAGLGLVAGNALAPAYGLTVTRDVAESITNKVEGTFDAPQWFSSLLASPTSVGWDEVADAGVGPILVALTKPYANMAGSSLSKASPNVLARLRIFGANLTGALPDCLHDAIAPYDDRLDSIVPGTRSDFAQRALLHFVDHVVRQPSDRGKEFETVSAILSALTAPGRPVRSQRSDAELISLIRARVHPRASASGLLRQFRDGDGIACEQGRFARLFRVALAENTVS